MGKYMAFWDKKERKKEIMNKQTDVPHVRFKVWISLHDRSNEKMPDLF